MKFAYCKFDVDPGIRNVRLVYRPLIPLRLSGPGGEHDFWGLLDTGADESYITQEMADFLGAVPIEGKYGTVESACGDMVVRYCRLRLHIGQGSEAYEWDVYFGIVRDTWSEALLGHSEVLEHFDVTFFGENNEVELQRNHRPFDRTASTR